MCWPTSSPRGLESSRPSAGAAKKRTQSPDSELPVTMASQRWPTWDSSSSAASDSRMRRSTFRAASSRAVQCAGTRPGVAKRFRHAAIFGALDALHSGETMRFVNDHDPMPLLDQLRSRYGEGISIE